MQITYDNIIFSLQKAGGISAYWSELGSRFSTMYSDVEFYGDIGENIFARSLNMQVQKESFINYKVLRYLNFRKKLPKKSLFHSSYYRIASQKDVINITTVYDFTYEYYRRGLARLIHIWQKTRAINKSNGIICISESTKKDLLRFYPHIKREKIKVIYIAASDSFQQLQDPQKCLMEKYKILKNKKYILYVGDRNYYKNFNIAVECIEEIKDLHLVVVGGANLQSSEVKKVEDRIFHFQGINAKNLNILYNNAFCLLYPSSYEGFGIPILEAMRAGCPVVSSSFSSIPEVVGDAGLLVDDISKDLFIGEIEKLEDVYFRQRIINKGLEQAKKFSWDKCFKETHLFYEEILQKSLGASS